MEKKDYDPEKWFDFGQKVPCICISDMKLSASDDEHHLSLKLCTNDVLSNSSMNKSAAPQS